MQLHLAHYHLAHEDQVYMVLQHVEGWLAGVFHSDTDRELFLLAVMEAVNNVVDHALPKAQTDVVDVFFLSCRAWAMFGLRDYGPGFVPSIKNPEMVTGPRGRGLGYIQNFSDGMLFNHQGNEIVFVKGVSTMQISTQNVNAKQSVFPPRVILFHDVVFSQTKTSISQGLTELFESAASLGNGRHVFVDIKNIRLINSMAWGSIFAESEQNAVELLVFFNAGEAIIRSAKLMGLNARQSEVYGKIQLLPDCGQAMEMLAASLGADVVLT